MCDGRVWLVIGAFSIGAAFQLEAAACQSTSAPGMNKNDVKTLDGKWLLQSTMYGNEAESVTDRQRWDIAGTKLTIHIGQDAKPITYRLEIASNKEPSELDIIPVPPINHDADFFTRTKCLYFVQGAKLCVAITFLFAPGTREQELQRAVENADVRPKSFNTTEGDVFLLRFKRID